MTAPDGLSFRRATDDPAAELSATDWWFECWCGCEWRLAAVPAADRPLDEPCDRCSDSQSRRYMWALAL